MADELTVSLKLTREEVDILLLLTRLAADSYPNEAVARSLERKALSAAGKLLMMERAENGKWPTE